MKSLESFIIYSFQQTYDPLFCTIQLYNQLIKVLYNKLKQLLIYKFMVKVAE